MQSPQYYLNRFTQRLAKIRSQVNSLGIPRSSYLSVWLKDDSIDIVELGGQKISYHQGLEKERNVRNMLLTWLDNRALEKNEKFVTVEVIGKPWVKPIISDLWLKEDIVPYFIETEGNTETRPQKERIHEIAQRFFDNDIIKIRTDLHNEVEIAELVTLEDYRHITNPDEYHLLLTLAAKMKGKKLVFINASPQGGGVALMRHALMRLYRLLGVDAHWYVLSPMKEAFDITKTKFHNVLQAVADPDVMLTEGDKQLYNSWQARNADLLEDNFKDADVVVLDDPQPAGLVDFIKKTNPKSKIIYRSHIQIVSKLADKPGTPQHTTWQFIWDHIKQVDLFVSHPIKDFIPKVVPKSKTVLMPPATDALDGLNKPLTPAQTDYYLKLFDKLLIESNQTPLDKKRPYIIQIARFDPSKGIPDVIESYRLLRSKMEGEEHPIPQLVICGHGSIDDPDGIPIFNLIMDMLRQKEYQNLAEDVKMMRVPSIDQVLNVLLREARVALQLSHKEGFEVKVSEALMKGIPVAAYKAGGIPLQIVDGVSGFLVEVGNTEKVADRLYQLMTDDELYFNMSQAAVINVNPETTTVSNALNWLFLTSELINKGSLKGDQRSVRDLIKLTAISK